MDSPFMQAFATGLAGYGLRVARFEFPYMADYRKTGRRKPPDRESVLKESWLKVVEILGPQRLVIGGKSMGGRIASLIADEAEVRGLVCLGYPFHPVGQPARLRVQHLQTIRTPTLILQGTRDAFGNQGEVRELEDGEHSFKPRQNSGRTQEQNWKEAIDRVAAFVEKL
jgi:predicted alpha/beta-hydrolase family hydrolase